MASEGFYCLFGKRDRTTLAVLGRGETGAIDCPGKGTGDAYGSRLKVNVFPSQPEKLTYAQPRRHRHSTLSGSTSESSVPTLSRSFLLARLSTSLWLPYSPGLNLLLSSHASTSWRLMRLTRPIL